MSLRCRNTNAMTHGTHSTDSPAKIAPTGPPPVTDSRLYRASGAVIRFVLVMNRFGQKKSFQMYWPVMIITAEMAGQDIGIMTCRMIRRCPAPSILAASSSSVGMVRKCCRSKKIAMTWMSAGMMRLTWLFSRCRYFTTTNSGTAETWLGRVSAARNKVKITSRPRNSIRANAYAASTLTTAAPTTTASVTTTGIIAGPAQITTGASRLAGHRAALRAAGSDCDHSLTAYGDFRIDGGYAAAKQLLRLQRPPDGLLISNDLMTIGGLQAIAEAGLSIPGDIAVVGFDNASWATAFRPPLTVVTQPTYEIGQVAADLLLRRVSGEKFPPRHVVLRAKLVERESSRRSPQAG